MKSIPVYSNKDGRPYIEIALSLSGSQKPVLRLALTSRIQGVFLFDVHGYLNSDTTKANDDSSELCFFKDHRPAGACIAAIQGPEAMESWLHGCDNATKLSDLTQPLISLSSSSFEVAWQDGGEVNVMRIAEGFTPFMSLDSSKSELVPTRFLTSSTDFLPKSLKHFQGTIGIGAGPPCRPGYMHKDHKRGPIDLWDYYLGDHNGIQLVSNNNECDDPQRCLVGYIRSINETPTSFTDDIYPTSLRYWYRDRALQLLPNAHTEDATRPNTISLCGTSLAHHATGMKVGALLDPSIEGVLLPRGHVWDAFHAWISEVNGVECDYRMDRETPWWNIWKNKQGNTAYRCRVDPSTRDKLPALEYQIHGDIKSQIPLSSLVNDDHELLVYPNAMDDSIEFRKNVLLTAEQRGIGAFSTRDLRIMGNYPFYHPMAVAQGQNGTSIWPPIIFGHRVMTSLGARSSLFKDGGFDLVLTDTVQDVNMSCPSPFVCQEGISMAGIRKCLPPPECVHAWFMRYDENTKACYVTSWLLPLFLLLGFSYAVMTIKRSYGYIPLIEKELPNKDD